jgi:hypothetical protein
MVTSRRLSSMDSAAKAPIAVITVVVVMPGENSPDRFFHPRAPRHARLVRIIARVTLAETVPTSADLNP